MTMNAMIRARMRRTGKMSVIGLNKPGSSIAVFSVITTVTLLGYPSPIAGVAKLVSL
jgi:hypothetical protein